VFFYFLLCIREFTNGGAICGAVNRSYAQSNLEKYEPLSSILAGAGIFVVVYGIPF